MLFTSTRTIDLKIGFSQAVRQCIANDGGYFVPSPLYMQDLRNWLYYIDKDTSFKSIAGTLSSAIIGDEFSPVICENIVDNAYDFEPVIKQVDDNFYHLELYNTFSGTHRDFGIAYLCSFLEMTNNLKGTNSVLLEYSSGTLGALLAKFLRGKKFVKAIVIYESEDKILGVEEDDLVWNGGNIFPVVINKSKAEIKEYLKKIFFNRELAQEKNLTVVNSTNIGRLMGHISIFPYAFSRIKDKVPGEIYFAVEAGHYISLMSGLYNWRFGFPVNGFLVPATPGLQSDALGNPIILDSFIGFDLRGKNNPVIPANLERLEAFFGRNQHMMKDFIIPVPVMEAEQEKAAQELFTKYGIYIEEKAASSYATIMKKREEIFDEGGSIVLVSQRHPGLTSDFSYHCLGESPSVPELVRTTMAKSNIKPKNIMDFEDLKNFIKSVKIF